MARVVSGGVSLGFLWSASGLLVPPPLGLKGGLGGFRPAGYSATEVLARTRARNQTSRSCRDGTLGLISTFASPQRALSEFRSNHLLLPELLFELSEGVSIKMAVI